MKTSMLLGVLLLLCGFVTAADAAQVQERGELGAVAEGPRGREHGTAQRDTGQVDAGVDGAAHGSPSQATACPSNMGPSRQTSAKPPRRRKKWWKPTFA